ncbi:MAG: 30S ribosomal protein S8 [Desulfatiglans sp.]|jgi:small subunit ribosomal protein S8|nr:30S ribosomal protein S8 [Desulfatiglans sp.]
MGMTDPIADMLTRIRNAIMASYNSVDIPGSRMKINIAKVLKSEGFIKNFKLLDDKKQGIIKIYFKYDEKGVPTIDGLKRVSKPGCRIYAKRDNIPKILNGFGINILSTSKGIITDKQAREIGVGGEIICSIW